MKLVLILAMVIGLLGCSGVVGTDPQFQHDRQDAYNWMCDQMDKLDYAEEVELDLLYRSWKSGEITEDEYRTMQRVIEKKYDRYEDLLRIKFYEEF